MELERIKEEHNNLLSEKNDQALEIRKDFREIQEMDLV
jgi:hypothetical protein